jgi:hypothetical protein
MVLGHSFHSETILLGVDLPSELDAPFGEPSGRAVWYSFGTLVLNAAALILQVDQNELKVGVRPARRAPGRIHGEVFIYDDVPGGAGYARGIERNLEDILHKALELGTTCSNADCPGACYHCLYDYRNQMLHPLLDRGLGTAVLEYVLNGRKPSLERAAMDHGAAAFAEFARAAWTVGPAMTVGDVYLPAVLTSANKERVGLWVVHPLQSRPDGKARAAVLAQAHVRCAVHTSFDLERRPFWVWNNLLTK